MTKVGRRQEIWDIITSPKKVVLSTAIESLALHNHLKRSAGLDLEEERWRETSRLEDLALMGAAVNQIMCIKEVKVCFTFLKYHSVWRRQLSALHSTPYTTPALLLLQSCPVRASYWITEAETIDFNSNKARHTVHSVWHRQLSALHSTPALLLLQSCPVRASYWITEAETKDFN